MKITIDLMDKYNLLCMAYGNKYGFEEEWKDVIYNGVETTYQVSNYGRLVDTTGEHKPKLSVFRKHYHTHIKVDGKSISIPIYRLVAMTFIPIPKKYLDMGYTMDDLYVDHKRDGDKDNWDDNTIWNLQWLTPRENTSKASKCGYREAYPKTFRKELDSMIENDKSNDEIYQYFYEKYGMDKDELKAQVQVRRRRMGKTLKEHKERSKEELTKVDELIKKGLSNDEIIKKLNLPTEGRATESLLQHRREKLKVPAAKSKFLTNDQNNELNLLLIQGVKINDIVKYFGKEDLPEDELKRFKSTLRARRYQTRKRLRESMNK